MKTFRFIILSALSILSIQSILAQDRQFVRTYQSTVLPKGGMDLEAWSTFRTGRKYFFNQLDNRLELEIGLCDKLQTALYFNASHKAFGAYLDTLGGIADTSISGIFNESEFSVSSEWKWKLMDPSANAFGLALYAELGLAPNEWELENKIIIDKKTEKNIFSLNLVNEYEIAYDVKKGETEKEWEDEPEIDIAYMHMLKPKLGIGLEVVDKNEIEDGNWNFSALHAGPTLFYSGEKHFIILNVLPQLMNLHKTDDAPNNLVLNAQEKIQIRLLIGFSF